MKRPAERRVWPQEIQTRCESSRLADACLADAYARLVPPVRRLGTSSCTQAPSQVTRECLQDAREARRRNARREEGREEGRQCS